MLFEILRFLGPVISKNIQFDSTKTTSDFHLFHPSCYKYFWKIIKPNNISKNSIQTIESPWLVLLKLSKASLDWFSGWPHLQTLQLLGVGHLFWGEFCCHVFGLEDVDDPKSVGPRTLYSDDKHFEKRMTFNAFLGSPPGNFTNCLLDAYTKTKGLGRPVLQIAHARSFMETFTWNASLCSTHYVASGIPSMHLQHFDGNWHSSYRFLLTTSKLIFGWRLAA